MLSGTKQLVELGLLTKKATLTEPNQATEMQYIQIWKRDSPRLWTCWFKGLQHGGCDSYKIKDNKKQPIG